MMDDFGSLLDSIRQAAIELDGFRYSDDPWGYQLGLPDRETGVCVCMCEIFDLNLHYVIEYLKGLADSPDADSARVLALMELLKDIASKIPDTPERYAYDLWEYANSLHRTGIFESPFPRNKLLAAEEIEFELYFGLFSKQRELLDTISALPGAPSPASLIKRLKLLEQMHVDVLARLNVSEAAYLLDNQTYLELKRHGDAYTFDYTLRDAATAQELGSDIVEEGDLGKFYRYNPMSFACRAALEDSHIHPRKIDVIERKDMER